MAYTIFLHVIVSRRSLTFSGEREWSWTKNEEGQVKVTSCPRTFTIHKTWIHLLSRRTALSKSEPFMQKIRRRTQTDARQINKKKERKKRERNNSAEQLSPFSTEATNVRGFFDDKIPRLLFMHEEGV